MKLVLLSDGIPPAGKGGAERIAWESARSLKKKGYDVTILTTHRAGVRILESTIEDIRIVSIQSDYHLRWRAWLSVYNPRLVREVRRLLNEIRPDIVHAHNLHQHLSYATLAVARASGARVFHTFHDVMAIREGKLSTFFDTKNPVCKDSWNYRVSEWDEFRTSRLRYNPFRRMIIRQLLKNVHQLISVSTALRNALEQNGIQDIRVLYNGIDREEWSLPREKTQLFLTEKNLVGKKILLFGGRITGTKGGDALLAALPVLVKAVPDVVLLLMGTENEYVKSLQARALGIGKHIMTTGWISGDNLKAAYHSAAVVAVPSLYLDPLPTVVLEAMACGKPVVGSCLGGISEMVIDGVTGSIVHPLDTAAMAIKLIGLLQDSSYAIRLGTAGAALQSERFSSDKQIEELIECYEHE